MHLRSQPPTPQPIPPKHLSTRSLHGELAGGWVIWICPSAQALWDGHQTPMRRRDSQASPCLLPPNCLVKILVAPMEEGGWRWACGMGSLLLLATAASEKIMTGSASGLGILTIMQIQYLDASWSWTVIKTVADADARLASQCRRQTPDPPPAGWRAGCMRLLQLTAYNAIYR
jgi:hypothetical protein